MLKNLSLVLFSIFIISSCTSLGTSEKDVKLIPTLPDVPLPDGYAVDPNTMSFFDSAEGRIVEMYAAGFADREEIDFFYKEVMPRFGWRELEHLVYYKDGEILVITPEKGEYVNNTIKYQLKPSDIR